MYRWQLVLLCIMTYLKTRWLLPWILVGLLLGIGFVVPTLWAAGLLGIALTISLTLQTGSTKQVLLGSLLAWTIKSALALTWFWSVYPIEWLPVNLGGLELVVIFVWWLTASLWLGTGGMFFALVLRKLHQLILGNYALLAVPIIWVVAEMFGSLVFSILTIGTGGVITTAFSFGYVGYLAADHVWLVMAARMAGVYSLGVLLVGLATVGFFGWNNQPTKRPLIVLGFLFLFISGVLLPQPTGESSQREYTVAIIDTEFPLTELRTSDGRVLIAKKLEAAMQAALAIEPDYILLPEDSRYFNQANQPQLTKAQFGFRTGSPEVVIVDSGGTQVGSQFVLQSFIYNQQSAAVDQSQKRYLVPQGEFMPALYAVGLRLFGQGALVDTISQTLAYEIGSDLSQADYATSSPGILFCFESVSPWGARTIMRERAAVPFIAHPVSHAWFNEPQVLWNQLERMLRVQAIWSQQHIVSAGNHVAGYVVTPTGAVIYPKPVAQGEHWHLGTVNVPY